MIKPFLCAALSYPKKASEGLPWTGPHIPSEQGGCFHHAVNEWVENVRANTRLWSCFLAFTNLVQFIVICVGVAAAIYFGVK